MHSDFYRVKMKQMMTEIMFQIKMTHFQFMVIPHLKQKNMHQKAI